MRFVGNLILHMQKKIIFLMMTSLL